MSILLLCPGKKEQSNTMMLFIRKPDPKVEIWEGQKLTREEAQMISGIESVHWLEEFDLLSRKLILENTNIYCRTRDQVKIQPEYPSKDERYLIELKDQYPSHQYKRLTPLICQLRLKKEPEELEMIREAIRITSKGFRKVLSVVKDGIKEYEIEAVLTSEFIRSGATGHAYAPIIASGPNACILHYVVNDQVCHKGDLLLLDFGAEYANYAADCSRTIPVNGRFTGRQRELYDASLRVFRKTRDLIKPGNTIEIINNEVGKIWEEEHVSLGLYSTRDIQKQPKEDPLYMKYMMHGVSHFMGLDVHDVGSKQEILRPGMVLTCEPGIYVPAEKTGIRLENDILVTEQGNLDLMEDLAIEAEEIEDMMQP
jgi:Xaa-Pro aminopeptidase